MTEDFHATRRTGIGGSDMAVLLGVSPYKTKLELYLEKRGEAPPTPDNKNMKAGRMLENVIAEMVVERTGQSLIELPMTIRHPKHEFLIGNVDRIYNMDDVKRGLEIKNVGHRQMRKWGEDGDPDGVAEQYLPQVHHYLLVLDYPVFDVAAYFGGSDLRIYEVERDNEMDELIIQAAHDFWHRHVLPGIPPEPEFDHTTTAPLLKRLHQRTEKVTVEADEMLRHWAAVAESAAAKAAEYEKASELAKSHLLHSMGDAEILDLGNGRIFRRKLVKRKGYTVADTEYVDARFANKKGE